MFSIDTNEKQKQYLSACGKNLSYKNYCKNTSLSEHYSICQQLSMLHVASGKTIQNYYCIITE